MSPQITDHPALSLFAELLAVSSPSGREERMAQIVREKLDAWGYVHHPTLVAFTVHEEGDAHGAKVVAQAEKPEVFIAVDGCPMPPGTPLRLDGRPGIWSKDRRTHYDQRLIRALCRAAEAAGTELQPAVYDEAASDASLVYTVGAAKRVVCFGHVRENSHGYEVCRLSVFDNLFKTLVEFITTWEGD